jgi:hypothetical protein
MTDVSFLDPEMLAGYLVAFIVAIIAYWKNAKNKAAMAAIDPSNHSTILVPESSGIPDSIWKMSPDTFNEIVEGLGSEEADRINSDVNQMEAMRCMEYYLYTSVGTYHIENGYIESRTMKDEPGMPMIIDPRAVSSLDAAGRTVGKFKFDHFEQKIGEPVSELSMDTHDIFVVGSFEELGVATVGLKVGNEPLQQSSLQPNYSNNPYGMRSIRFDLWKYTPTMKGDSVELRVVTGRLGCTIVGTDETVWTTVEKFVLPIRH